MESPPSASPASLSLEARAENAALARRLVVDEAARAGLPDRVTADAKVVVTESFTNVTRHAYPDRDSGQVELEVRGDDEGMTIVVRDSGSGFRPRVPEDRRLGGLGLGLIAALADRFELRRLDAGGSELRARVDAARAAAGEPIH